MNAPNSSGVLVIGSTPALANLGFMSGALTAFASSAFRRLMISRGVPVGASMPYQTLISKFGKPDSFDVGTFGRSLKRSGISTASARTRPALICCTAAGAATTSMSVSPPTSAPSATPDPLYGTCTMSSFSRLFSSSGARWVVVPTPPDP